MVGDLKRRTQRVLDPILGASGPISPAEGVADFSMLGETKSLRRRLLDRDGRFFQSKGIFSIRRTGRHMRLKWDDWFHSLIHWNTVYIMLLASATYTFFFLLFSPFYYIISDDCGLEITSLRDAFYLSVETMVTIGYGVPDPYFRGCLSGAFVILIQSLVGVLLDAVLLGVIFSRISRGQRRANTVIFSDKAIIREVDGKPYFMFQVCEMRKHQLSEVHVRCYAMHRQSRHGMMFQSLNMRLCHPDDELGGMLLIAMPSIIVHAIDKWSPLYPSHWLPNDDVEGAHNSYKWPQMFQREMDALSGGRDMFVCKACGESFFSRDLLNTHIRYSIVDDTISGHVYSTSCQLCGETFSSFQNLKLHHDSSHQEESKDLEHASTEGYQEIHSAFNHAVVYENFNPESQPHEPNTKDIREFLEESNTEVICLLEGIDVSTSYTIQARHSYNSDDIEWEKMFEPCVSEDADGKCCIDFVKFHQLRNVQGGDLGQNPF